MSNEDNKGDSWTPNSLVRDDLPEGGLADSELEILRKRQNDERKEGFRKYAKDKLPAEGEGFE